MNDQEVLDRLQEVFRDIFDDPEISLGRETTSDDIEDWDSLANINLVVAVEKEFSVKFELQDIRKFGNLGDVVDMIKEKSS